MKSSVTTLEENKVKVSVEVDETEIDDAITVAFRKIAKEVRLPGFRPGKAPRKVLEARMGKGYARGEALNEALPDYYRQAIIEHDVDVIAPPDLDITSGQEDGPVVFEAIVEVRPTVTIAGYDGLRVEIPAPAATDEEINGQIDSLRAQSAEREEVQRPAIDDDFITVDIAGSQDDEPVEGLTADDYTYVVGSGFVVEEFDEHMRGAKVGDIIEFEAAHPNEEDATLSFRVLVKKIEQNVLPELTDEFVAETTEFETADELIADTRTRIETMKRSQTKMLVADRTAEALAKLVTIDLPEALVQDQMQQQLQDMAMRLAQQGIKFDQFIEATGQDPAAVMENLREPAEQAARVDLALRAVAEAESLEITDEDILTELDKTAVQLGQDGTKLRATLEENGQLNGLRIDMAKQRAMELLIEKVEIVDEDGNAIDAVDLEPVEDNADEESDVTQQTADSPQSVEADEETP